MTPLRFLFVFVFLCTRCFLINRLRKYVPAIIASIMTKFGQFLWERFWNIWKRSFKNHKNIETAWRKHPQLPPFPFFSPQFYISKSLPIYGCQLWKVWKYTCAWSYEKLVKQTFCNFSQLQLSFFVHFVVRDLCRCGCRQNFATFYQPPPPPPPLHPIPLFFFFVCFVSFSSYPQFSLQHKWQLFEISARLKLASVPFSSLHFLIGHLKKSFPESIM